MTEHEHQNCLDITQKYIDLEDDRKPPCVSNILIQYCRAMQDMLRHDQYPTIKTFPILINTKRPELEAARLKRLITGPVRQNLADSLERAGFHKHGQDIRSAKTIHDIHENASNIAWEYLGTSAPAKKYPKLFHAARLAGDAALYAESALQIMKQPVAGQCPTCGAPPKNPTQQDQTHYPRMAANLAAQTIHALTHGQTDRIQPHRSAIAECVNLHLEAVSPER